ncbi:MAG: HD domain-containing protein [Lachnospiraceae bacterium]|nr:HD domain-containing protein [Lachnospiraceae bacterium]
MNKYETTYLDNTEKIMELVSVQPTASDSAEAFYALCKERTFALRPLIAENMSVLRDFLIPLLDDILAASPETVAELTEFDDALSALTKQADNGIHYQINSALVIYARHKKNRELLIRSLYHSGMALWYYNNIMRMTDPSKFQWKMRLLFGEAASYIRQYDEIEDEQTRGYIHRSMSNLALSYNSFTEAEPKFAVLRRALNILQDPVFHQKTPSLPWKLYITKTHQERTTLLGYLRHENASLTQLHEVMESAEYVHHEQLMTAQKKNIPMQPQWLYAYYAACYHCGFHTLAQLFENLEQLYISASQTDYSQQGMYTNLFLPAMYTEYVHKDESHITNKAPIMQMIYQRALQYVRNAPAGTNTEFLYSYLRALMFNFIEYPHGISLKEFAYEFIMGRHLGTCVHSIATAKLAVLLLDSLLARQPEALLGLSGFRTVDELTSHREELAAYIYDCGIFHDIGKLFFLQLFTLPNRQWLSLEVEMCESHAIQGYRLLCNSPSTKMFASAAFGHHRHYDGKGGYPKEFSREECGDPASVDIIAAADFIEYRGNDTGNAFREANSLEHIFAQLKEGRGTRFSPAVVDAVLGIKDEVADFLLHVRPEAYRIAYEYGMKDK